VILDRDLPVLLALCRTHVDVADVVSGEEICLLAGVARVDRSDVTDTGVECVLAAVLGLVEPAGDCGNPGQARRRARAPEVVLVVGPPVLSGRFGDNRGLSVDFLGEPADRRRLGRVVDLQVGRRVECCPEFVGRFRAVVDVVV